MTLVKFADVADRDWLVLEDGADAPADAAVIVGIERLEAEGEKLFETAAAVGVKLGSGEEPMRLAGFIDQLALVALEFPVFSDGRSYSAARIVREQMGFQGELRAVGDVLADQLRFMMRCGFDSAQLAARVSEASARRALERYSVVYQAASDEAAPAHRLRRVAAAR